MQIWEKKWLVNFKTEKIRMYLVDFQTKQVHDPQRFDEIGHQEFIRDGFKNEREAKIFYKKYKNNFDKKLAKMIRV